jgi:hypothetical protein
LSASGTGTLLALASSSGNTVQTLKIPTSADRAFFQLLGEAAVGRRLEIGYWGSTATTAYGAAAGESVINSAGNLNFSIADVKVVQVTSTGLAVTGALSNTTGANFATSSGSVGIGTASPREKLEISGASPVLLINNTSGGTNVKNFYLSNTGGNFGINLANDAYTGFTNLVTVTNGGNVGIGQTSPGAKLDISGNIRLSGANPNIEFNNGGGMIYGPAANTLAFATGGGPSSPVERARIDSSGNLLVGTTTSGYGSIPGKFTSCSATSGSAGLFYTGFSGDVSTSALNIGKFDNDNSTSQIFVKLGINNAGTGSGQINANGGGQAAFGSFSDARLKENIVTLDSQLLKILALRPVEFDYKDGSGHQTGFVAQEMQEVYPDAVAEADGYLTLTGFGKTEARIIKAIQELNANLVAELQSVRQRLAALETR